MQIIQLPPGNVSEIIQIMDLSALKDLDHQAESRLSVRGATISRVSQRFHDDRQPVHWALLWFCAVRAALSPRSVTG